MSILNDYRAGLQMWKDAIFSSTECSCPTCQEERQEKISMEALRTVWPKINFIPFGKYATQRHWSSVLQSAYHARCDYEGATGLLCHCCFSETKGDIQLDGHILCARCESMYAKCQKCGKVHHKHELSMTDTGTGRPEFVCPTCRPSHYVYCMGCSVFHDPSKLTSFVTHINERGGKNRVNLCSKCCTENQKLCSSCYERFPKKIMRGIYGNYKCPECAEMAHGLQQYYFKPLVTRFHRLEEEGTVSEEAFHMGYELEVANKQSEIGQEAMCHLIKEIAGSKTVYTMHDGTIEDSTGYKGIEVVTHPFTWEYYTKKMKYTTDDIITYLRSKGWKANMEGIGFHVHTTKAAWTTFQLYKLLQFIYRNQSFITKVAQREPTNYCKISEEDYDQAARVAKDKKNRREDHYSAINLNQGNYGIASKTVEFRMFQGTLEPLYIHKNIEFVYACWLFTQQCATMTTAVFLTFVQRHRRVFPALYEFLRKEELVCV